jgi:hypothetical protein
LGKSQWVDSKGNRLEELIMNQEPTWVFLSTQHGLLIAKQLKEDFRLIEEWTTDFVNTISCRTICSDSYYPSKMPSRMTKYNIDIEHHLSGITVSEWETFEVEAIYTEALAFVFDVPIEDIDVTSAEEIIPLKGRRLLQTPTLMVRATVYFTVYKRFEEFRHILQSFKGRASLNAYFSFLLSDNESGLDNMGVQHMGIEGDFDMISYFTTISPTPAPTDSLDVIGGSTSLGTQIEIRFKGATHNDISLHELLTDVLNSKSTKVVDTHIISSTERNGLHEILVDLDCEFVQCAPEWRREERISDIQNRIREEEKYSEFTILRADVQKRESSGTMQISDSDANDNSLYLLLAIASLVMLFVCFLLLLGQYSRMSSQKDLIIHRGDQLASEKHGNPMASGISLVARSFSDTAVIASEGDDTHPNFGFRKPNLDPPTHEGFAPTSNFSHDQSKMIPGAYDLKLQRMSTNECNDYVYANSTDSRLPNYRKEYATYGSGLSESICESDTDMTMYEHQAGILTSDGEYVAYS